MIYRPMLAKTANKDDLLRSDMSAERKFDGTRLFIVKEGFKIKLLVARGAHSDYTLKYPTVVSDAKKLKCHSCILDGEFVFFDKRGHDVFLTIAAGSERIKSLKYKVMVFDILSHNGHDLRGLPIEKRKAFLDHLIPKDLTIIREVDVKRANKDKYFKQVTKNGGEGIVLKEDASLYHPGKSKEWLKFKKVKELDVIVKGATYSSEGSRTGFFRALQCYYPINGKLSYVGDVGSGFDSTDLKQILPIVKSGKPFVIQVRFMEMSPHHHMRFPVFERLRPDKTPNEVMRNE